MIVIIIIIIIIITITITITIIIIIKQRFHKRKFDQMETTLLLNHNKGTIAFREIKLNSGIF